MSDPLRDRIEGVMEAAWREPGFCVPNQKVYPHQWLWDSCFHSLVWLALGRPDRALTEVATALSAQDGSGLVPHMIYHHAPELHAGFWGRSGASVITQPPMYGHALAELARAGVDVPDELFRRAEAGLRHLLDDRPRTGAGLVPVHHPWETGCDDSLRWDGWLPTSIDPAGPDEVRIAAWRERKGEMVAELVGRVPPGSNRFQVGSIGFNALVAWNARELTSVVPSIADRMTGAVDRLVVALADRWNGETWVDDGMPPGPASGGARTLDAMTCLLVAPRAEGFEQLVDPGAFGAANGPRGCHRAEPAYRPDVYWRGPAWPQLTYLMTVAADRAGRSDHARELTLGLLRGAERSGLAEYWDPETGEGLGAVPQTWAALALPARRFVD